MRSLQTSAAGAAKMIGEVSAEWEPGAATYPLWATCDLWATSWKALFIDDIKIGFFNNCSFSKRTEPIWVMINNGRRLKSP